MQKKKIITIAGRPGSGKSTTAKLVAKMLGYKHFSSGDLFRAIAREYDHDVLTANVAAEKDATIDHLVDQRLRNIGKQDSEKVIDSRTAWHWIPQSYKIYLDLDFETAAKRILASMDAGRIKAEHIPEDPSEYANLLATRFASENRRYDMLYKIDPSDRSNYDIIIDTATNAPEVIASQIVDAYTQWLAD